MSRPSFLLPLFVLGVLGVLAGPAAGERPELFNEGSDLAESLIVQITGGFAEGAGILFAIDERYAYGVTARHVLFQRGRLVAGLTGRFRAWPEKQLPLEPDQLHPDRYVDLATFRIPLGTQGINAATLAGVIPFDQLGDADSLDPGDDLFTVGHAPGGAWVSPERPAKLDATDHGLLRVEHFCPKGHSGGGIFDQRWRLVGMIFANEAPYCNALPINQIVATLRDWGYEVGLEPPANADDPIIPEAPREINVAVVDFDNRSGQRLPRIGLMAQEITTSYIYSLPGVRVVTRDRLDSVLAEINRTGTVGSSEGLSRIGRLLDVDAVVTGAVIRYDVERREFHGYRTSALSDTYRMEASIQVIAVDTGVLQFAHTFDIEDKKTYPKATSAPSRPVQRESELLEELLHQAERPLKVALEQVAAGVDTIGRLIAVPVTSEPSGANVLLRGAVVGSTPITLSLASGTHELTLIRAGYEDWNQRIRVKPGLEVRVHLTPRLGTSP